MDKNCLNCPDSVNLHDIIQQYILKYGAEQMENITNIAELEFRLKMLEKNSEKQTDIITKALEKISDDIQKIQSNFTDLKVLGQKVEHIDDTVDALKLEHEKKANNEKVEGLEKRLAAIEESNRNTMKTTIFTLVSFVLTALGTLIFFVANMGDKVAK